jgi:TonB-linked SusC/RagA family outer membrane protein
MEKVSQLPERQSKYAEGSSGKFAAFSSTSWGPRIDTCRYATDDAAFPANPSKYSNAADYMKKWDPNGYIVSQNDPLSNGKPIVTYDPYEFFQTAYTYNNNLGISGGNERSTFYFSIGNTNATGVVPNNSFNKTNFKISADHKLNAKFSMGANINYSSQKSQRIQQGSNTSGVMLGLLRTPITFDNSYGYIFENGKQRSYRGGTGYDNPYWTANKNWYKGHADRVIGDIHLSYAPLTWMNVTYRLGVDLISGGYRDYLAKYSNTYPDGSVEVDNSINRDLNSDLLLNFHKTFGDLDASLTLGNNMYQSTYEGTNAQALNIVITDWDNMANTTDNRGYEASNEKRTLAFFGELALGYKSMLFFDATLRNEQSTTLPEANNSFFYPSVSLGFIFTELGGLKDNNILSFGKLRASYAVTAQDAALYATDNYYYVGAFLDGWTTGIQFPFLGVSGYTYTDQLGNLDLKPEKMKTFEVGGEFRFLNNRLHLDVAYFQNTNTDLLLSVPIAFSTGYGNKYMNAASMTTTGIELELDADIVKSKSFTWNLAFNWANPKTMVDELAPGVDNLFLGGFTGSQIRAVAGQEYRSVYATTWAKDANGNILINPTGSYAGYPVASNNMEYIADVAEDWRMGIINTFNLKGISLLALLEIKHGGYMWNGTRGALDYFGTSKGTEDREPTDLSVYEGVYGYLDPISGDPIYLDAAGNESATAVANDQQVRKNKQSWRLGNGSGFQGPSEDYVESAGWVRLREVTLSYDLPASLLQKSFIRQLGVFCTGRNLWLSTDYSGIDPETNLLGASNAQGIDYFNMPGTKSYTFGLKVTF